MKDLYESKAKAAAARHGVPWELGSAVITQESQWDAKAKSGAGAMGLMQLMPATAKGRGVVDPYDVDQNLEAGMAELGSHLKKYKGDLTKSLAAYNWGQGNVDRKGVKVLPAETSQYIRKITRGMAMTTAAPRSESGMVADVHGNLMNPKMEAVAQSSFASPLDEADFQGPSVLEQNQAMLDEAAAKTAAADRERLAAGEATVGDALRNAWENSVTMKLVDGFKFKADPSFKATDAHKKQLTDAGLMADPDRFNAIVSESTSEEMFQDRLATWNEDKSFGQKLSNTAGAWKRVGIQAAGIAGSIADPALIVAGMGVGAVGFRAGAGVLKMATADIAVGNTLSSVANEVVQQEYNAEDAIADTLLAGAFTGVGHAFAKGVDALRANRAVQRTADRVADAPESVPGPVEVTRTTPATPVQPREFDASAEANELLAGFRADAAALSDSVSTGSAASVARSNFISDNLREADAIAEEFRALAAGTDAERVAIKPADSVESLWGVALDTPTIAAKSFGDALEQIKGGSKDAVLRTLATKLQAGLNDVSVVLNDVNSALYQRTVGNLQVSGRVNKVAPVAGQKADLFVQPQAGKVSEITVVHEGTHLATLGATLLMDGVNAGRIARAGLSPNQSKALAAAEALENLRVQYLDELGDKADGVYGLTNVNEFAAEAASPEFRALLASVDAPKPGLLAALSRMGEALMNWLGVKGKAKKADYLQSVFNLMDESGNLRKPEEFKRVEAQPDYSFGGAFLNSQSAGAAQITPQQLQLSVAAQRLRKDLMDAPEPVTAGTEEVSAKVRKYLEGFGDDTGVKGVVNDLRTAFMAMGTRGALSESKAVRVIMNKLVEDPTGAAKSAGETAASHAGKLKAEALAKTKAFDDLMADVFTADEKAELMTSLGGSAETRERVNAAVFYEMASRRDAANAGTVYTPTDVAAAKVADLIDDVQTFVFDEAAASGNTHANKIKSSGITGWTPYKWSTEKLFNLRNSDPAKYNDMIGLLKQQYLRDTLRPALDKLLAKGPQQKGMDALFSELEGRADYLVAAKLDGITQGGAGFDLNRISFTAEELLKDVQSRGMSDAQTREAFQKELADVLADRSRHEMNLTEKFGSDGTMLMDVMDFDAEGAMHSTINKFSGLSGLAREAGIKDEEDMAVLLSVLRESKGVTKEDLEVVRLSLHQLGFADPDVKSVSPHLTAGLQIASASMLGKRVFSTMADFAAITIHSGGLVKSTKAMIDGIKKDDALINQFRELDMELVGEGWKVDSKNADLDPSGRADALNTVGRIGKRAGRLNSLVSMHRSVYGSMRRGVTRMAAAEVISAIAKGVPSTRLAALGISVDDAAAIRAAWPGHTAYQQGEALPFARRGKALEPHMLPYELSEKLQTAITRQVDKAMPQSRWVGEQAKFAAEGGGLSAVFMQFLHNSFTAHNKVVIQGIAHDKWSALGYMTTVGIPVGLALYHLRVAANTVGMSDEEKVNYEERALEPQAMVMGVLNSVSAFGMVGTGLSWMDTLVGGMADGSTPAAALGYATRVSKAAGAGETATRQSLFGVREGESEVSFTDALGAGVKILPTGTTIPATLLYNLMLKND